MPRTLTALYDNRASADAARDRLIQAGVSRSEIDVHDQTAYGDQTAPAHKGGMMEGLKNMFSFHDDHQAYGEGLSRGNILLSTTVDDAQAGAAIDILDGSGAIDFDRSQEDWRASGWAGQPASTGSQADITRAGATDDVIQVAEERLVVGKREVERGGVRVRSYVVETPVSEQVRLREERVSIERRPVNRALGPVTPPSRIARSSCARRVKRPSWARAPSSPRRSASARRSASGPKRCETPCATPRSRSRTSVRRPAVLSIVAFRV